MVLVDGWLRVVVVVRVDCSLKIGWDGVMAYGLGFVGKRKEMSRNVRRKREELHCEVYVCRLVFVVAFDWLPKNSDPVLFFS